MMIFLFVMFVLLFLAISYYITLYNNLISIRNNVNKEWSQIDVLLKQRHDELPKLVETCKGYMKYEQETLDKVIKARNSIKTAQDSNNIAAVGAAEQMLRSTLGQLFALAENYPDLKANETFHHLQTRISELESQIADRRETYNESVNIYNIRIAQFPDTFIANQLRYKPFAMLQFSAEELKDVEVRF